MKYQDKVEADIVGDIEAANKKLVKWRDAKAAFEDFLNVLPEEVETSVSIYGGANLDIYAYGNGELLTRVVRALRTTGWETKAERPKANAEGWIARFTHQYSERKIDLNFSSTVCHKVKVGTTMKEVDVFEIRCSDETPTEVIDEPNQSV